MPVLQARSIKNSLTLCFFIVIFRAIVTSVAAFGKRHPDCTSACSSRALCYAAKACKCLQVWRGILRLCCALCADALFLLSQFVKFANIEEDTPSYHRSYDFFVSRFSEMCHSSHDDLEIRTK